MSTPDERAARGIAIVALAGGRGLRRLARLLRLVLGARLRCAARTSEATALRRRPLVDVAALLASSRSTTRCSRARGLKAGSIAHVPPALERSIVRLDRERCSSSRRARSGSRCPARLATSTGPAGDRHAHPPGHRGRRDARRRAQPRRARLAGHPAGVRRPASRRHRRVRSMTAGSTASCAIRSTPRGCVIVWLPPVMNGTRLVFAAVSTLYLCWPCRSRSAISDARSATHTTPVSAPVRWRMVPFLY